MARRFFVAVAGIFCVILFLPVLFANAPYCAISVAHAQENSCLAYAATNSALELKNFELRMTIDAQNRLLQQKNGQVITQLVTVQFITATTDPFQPPQAMIFTATPDLFPTRVPLMAPMNNQAQSGLSPNCIFQTVTATKSIFDIAAQYGISVLHL